MVMVIVGSVFIVEEKALSILTIPWHGNGLNAGHWGAPLFFHSHPSITIASSIFCMENVHIVGHVQITENVHPCVKNKEEEGPCLG
jgi:hypothetical protein